MRRLIWISLLLLGVISAEAQFKSGGLGYFSIGGDFHTQPNLASNLEATWPPIPNVSSGLGIGGGGFSLFSKRGIFIGHGFGSRFARPRSNDVSIEQTMGGGGLGFGYALLNANDALLFPTLQFCGMGQTLVLNNGEEHPRYFGNEMLERGETATYETGFWYMDLGLQFHKLIRLGKSGDARGISLGLSAGYRRSFSQTEWSRDNQNTEVQGTEPQGLSGMYLRIHIGGGGFYE